MARQPNVSGVPRRRSLPILVLTLVVASVVVRATFRSEIGSSRLMWLTYVLAAVLLAGSWLSGRSWPKAHRRSGRHPLVGPVLTAVLLFVTFSFLGWAFSWIGPLDDGVDAIVSRARAGTWWQIALVAAAAGVAEEVMFRGALFERVRLPVVTAALAHMAMTLPTGNPALTLAAGFLGVVLGLSRRTSGGWFAPAVTHVVWALLMAFWLPR
jgi:hypothetical protein